MKTISDLQDAFDFVQTDLRYGKPAISLAIVVLATVDFVLGTLVLSHAPVRIHAQEQHELISYFRFHRDRLVVSLAPIFGFITAKPTFLTSV